jgi:hypothetical protein
VNFIKHENFPDAQANLIRHFEYQLHGQTLLQFPQELYGDSVTPKEWLACVGKQAKPHRPVIVTLDHGVVGNAITRKAMQESGCSFVVLGRTWADQPVETFAWRIIKAWPKIVELARSAHDGGRQCKIDVPLKGEPKRTNF